MAYRIAKGVFDILPKVSSESENWRAVHLWQFVETKVIEICHTYGFSEIRTPLFEQTELFERSVGTGTDIVSKEMYTFFDKANRSLTLRPEGTASVMRSLIENKVLNETPCQKLYYLSPMFRYERRQAGRYRQHHQFGIEAVGNDAPEQDAEVIDLLFALLLSLGLKGLTLQINSIGNSETRDTYTAALRAYLAPHLDRLSVDSQARYESNVLRILDSKDTVDRDILQKAPSILEFLDPESKKHFDSLLTLLQEIAIPYVVSPNLVRGLDYYNRTVFEVTSNELGAQNSLGGGGRYDTLIHKLGGPCLPAIGFGAGIERIIQTCLGQKIFLPSAPHVTLYLIALGESAKQVAFSLACTLRRQHIAVTMDFSDKKLAKMMRQADNTKARYVAVIGDEELKNETISLKEMASGTTKPISFQSLVEVLKNV